MDVPPPCVLSVESTRIPAPARAPLSHRCSAPGDSTYCYRVRAGTPCASSTRTAHMLPPHPISPCPSSPSLPRPLPLVPSPRLASLRRRHHRRSPRPSRPRVHRRTTHLHPRRDTVAVCVRGRRALRVPAQRTWAHRAHLPIPILPLFPLPFPPRSHHTPPRLSRCIAVAAAVPASASPSCIPPHNAPAPTRVHLALCTGCCLRALAPTLGANSVRVQTSLPRVRRVCRVSAPDIHARADRVCAGCAVATPPHTPAPLHPHPFPSPLPSSHPRPLPSFPFSPLVPFLSPHSLSLPCPFPPRSHHTHPVPPHCVTVAIPVPRVRPQRTRAESIAPGSIAPGSIAPGTVPVALYTYSHTHSARTPRVRAQMSLPRVRRARRVPARAAHTYGRAD
ncbi:hypothetical protein B0H16DRAFT_1895614 [Mycena metata]|uniref:Uncharacterized protein n=1 Tax=Mycena metata TaxID=1033252 RepID=A0AAD7HMS8_9AGAR|nr:hypothetical protein B0H16DRAFT_1895614 [Mycena metata]